MDSNTVKPYGHTGALLRHMSTGAWVRLGSVLAASRCGQGDTGGGKHHRTLGSLRPAPAAPTSAR